MAEKKTHEEYIAELKVKNPNIEALEKYSESKIKILHRCITCSHEWMILPSNALKGYGCPKCADKQRSEKYTKTHEQFISDLLLKNSNVEVFGTYRGSNVPIKTQCKKCNGIWYPRPGNLLTGYGCPYCGKTSRKILIGFNDLLTTDPIVSKWLLNPEDGLKYSRGSAEKVDWKCPSCDSIVIKKSINGVVDRKKVPCRICLDGISYPEKFMFSLLSQLNIYFETEKSFLCNEVDTNGKRTRVVYDFFFKINGHTYIVETDGKFHVEDNRINGVTLEEVEMIDAAKDELAKKHGIILVRIDCRESDPNFIKNNIIKSKLSSILNLNKVNWDKCAIDAIKSHKKQSADLWNSGMTVVEISKQMKRHKGTIVKWLKDCAEVGLCDYNSDSWKERLDKSKLPANSRSIICVETNQIYKTISAASRDMKISDANICSCCKGKKNTAGGFHWKYAS